MSEARLVEAAADRGHASVHHVRRRHDVGAGARVRHRRPGQQRKRRVVVDLAVAETPQWPWEVYSSRQTSVTTRRSGTAFLRARTASWTAAPSSQASLPVSSLRSGRPNRRTAGTPRDAELLRERDRLVRGDAVDARKRADGLAQAAPLAHEERSDELLDRQPGLADQGPGRGGASQAAQAGRREAVHRRGRRLFPRGRRCRKPLEHPGRRSRSAPPRPPRSGRSRGFRGSGVCTGPERRQASDAGAPRPRPAGRRRARLPPRARSRRTR